MHPVLRKAIGREPELFLRINWRHGAYEAVIHTKTVTGKVAAIIATDRFSSRQQARAWFERMKKGRTWEAGQNASVPGASRQEMRRR
jgi:hypothetical protein